VARGSSVSAWRKAALAAHRLKAGGRRLSWRPAKLSRRHRGVAQSGGGKNGWRNAAQQIGAAAAKQKRSMAA